MAERSTERQTMTGKRAVRALLALVDLCSPGLHTSVLAPRGKRLARRMLALGVLQRVSLPFAGGVQVQLTARGRVHLRWGCRLRVHAPPAVPEPAAVILLPRRRAA